MTTEKTPATDDAKNATPKVPAAPGRKALLTKNLLLALFVVLAAVYCGLRYLDYLKNREYRLGMDLYQHAQELFASQETCVQSYAEFMSASEFFKSAMADADGAERSKLAAKMYAESRAMMAQCPSLDISQSLQHFREALAADWECEKVGEPVRAKFRDEFFPPPPSPAPSPAE